MRDWLIALRNEQKKTAAEVAKELDVSPAYYSMIEKGKRQKKMDITLVARLAQVFGITIEQIVALEEEV